MTNKMITSYTETHLLWMK